MNRPPIPVVVEFSEEDNPDFEDLEILVNPYSTVYAAKCLVAEQWPLPALCQHFSIDGLELVDDAQIVSYADKLGRLYVMVEEQCVKLINTLQDNDPARRLAAIRALGLYSKRNRAVSIELMSQNFQGLDDPVAENRLVAIHTFCSFATKKDEQGLIRLCALLRDAEVDVRSTAREALCNLADPGQDCVIRALLPMLKSWQGPVRRDVLLSLMQLAKQGHDQTIKAICERLEDPDIVQRRLAHLALKKIAVRATATVLTELQKRIDHTDQGVRISVLQTLLDFYDEEKGSENLVKRAVARLQDPEALAEERRAAATLVAAASPKGGAPGSRVALEALMAVLGELLTPEECMLPQRKKKGSTDPQDNGQEGNSSSNSSDSEEEKQVPVLAIPKPDPDTDAEVRRIAVLASAKVARAGDPDVLVAVTDRLQDEDGKVRRSAATAVPIICPPFRFTPEDPIWVSCHCHALEFWRPSDNRGNSKNPTNNTKGKGGGSKEASSTSWECDDPTPLCSMAEEGQSIRWSCKDCDYHMCRGCTDFYRSDRIGLAGVVQRMKHRSEDVRFVAMKALRHIAPEANHIIVIQLVRCFRRGRQESRKLALELLLALADPTSKAADALRTQKPRSKPPAQPPPPLPKPAATAPATRAKAAASPEKEGKKRHSAQLGGEDIEDEEEEEDEEGEEEELDDVDAALIEEIPSDDPFNDEELKELLPAQAWETVIASTRDVLLAELAYPCAGVRLMVLQLLELLLPPPTARAPVVATATQAIAKMLKDKELSVRTLAAEILQRRSAEPCCLRQSCWPLGIRLTGMMYDEEYFNARNLAITRRQLAFDRRMSARLFTQEN